MRKVSIIGIGAGNPDYLTLQAVRAIGAAEVFFIPDKGEEKAALKTVRGEMLARHASPGHRLAEFVVPQRSTTPTYAEGVAAWRAALRETYQRLLTTELGENRHGAFLVWGDPSLYDGTIGILDDIRAAGFPLEVEAIPGISAVSALCAAHRVQLNRTGEAITITTARRVLNGEADNLTSFIVMLDSEGAWKRFSGEDAEIFWGAYLGMGEEILVSGRIADVADEIERVRAAARERNGWVMDTYMVRRPL
ncbi:MAG TPA: precorrin-6A synthase (deacetylating) [Devosia sp.]|nr:precorrin-6A synthase (deacetylating) [Devosia sp.]